MHPPRALTVAYHAAGSLQHEQKVTEALRRLLVAAGYTVRIPVEAHICCGSAGTYNILQPEIAGQLGARKVQNLDRLGADASGTVLGAVRISGDTSDNDEVCVIAGIEALGLVAAP